jgi:hypothetical protein
MNERRPGSGQTAGAAHPGRSGAILDVFNASLAAAKGADVCRLSNDDAQTLGRQSEFIALNSLQRNGSATYVANEAFKK